MRLPLPHRAKHPGGFDWHSPRTDFDGWKIFTEFPHLLAAFAAVEIYSLPDLMRRIKRQASTRVIKPRTLEVYVRNWLNMTETGAATPNYPFHTNAGQRIAQVVNVKFALTGKPGNTDPSTTSAEAVAKIIDEIKDQKRKTRKPRPTAAVMEARRAAAAVLNPQDFSKIEFNKLSASDAQALREFMRQLLMLPQVEAAVKRPSLINVIVVRGFENIRFDKDDVSQTEPSQQIRSSQQRLLTMGVLIETDNGLSLSRSFLNRFDAVVTWNNF